ncbi:hypothetical protein AAFF_G00356130 [Aldrovandia affinis]|uniref:Uncharacterized protein n=1 Tax=Aldrovandia affinis TaxID=143900 RepID=A0AAD7VZG6_9TELE|nr:hypothetical protein AAFF_G00356130 [Aldrovandia affinis]
MVLHMKVNKWKKISSLFAGDRPVQLDLENSTVSDPGLKLILGCVEKLQNIRLTPSLHHQLWSTALCCGQQCDLTRLLRVCGNEIHLSVQADRAVCERAGEVMKQSPESIKLCLHWDQFIQTHTDAIGETICQCLPHISTISFSPPKDQKRTEEWNRRVYSFQLDLLLKFQNVKKPVKLRDWSDEESEVGSFLQCLPYISELIVGHWTFTKTTVSKFLGDLFNQAADLLKFQNVKKPVKLRDWSDEESEVGSFLQCLPYISELIVGHWTFTKTTVSKFLGDLFNQAADCETAETTLKLLSSVCSYDTFPFYLDDDDQCDFLLDLYSHVKGDETQTGRRVLSALQPVYQSAPAVWDIDLSQRKVSLFLEVLKFQKVKKPVELRDWSDEESEVGSFLQCLPYISELSFSPPEYQQRPSEEWNRRVHSFQLDLCMQGALYETQTGEKTVMTPLSLLRLDSPELQSRFMLDLYSHVKDYETQTGRRVLLALQPVYQSAPAVWDIDLSQRKVSLFLEVLKFQKVKKPVKLRDWSDEESEVGSFLQCLPYISQLSFSLPEYQQRPSEEWNRRVRSFQLDLCVQGALYETQTGEKTVMTLLSVLRLDSPELQSGFMLDLYSHVKDYETQTGRRVLSALQPVYQSAPAVWDIDLSKRKVSLFLEVLKFQNVKKPVKLRDWSDEESEVGSFLQCLPYISQLIFSPPEYQQRPSEEWNRRVHSFQLDLCVAANRPDPLLRPTPSTPTNFHYKICQSKFTKTKTSKFLGDLFNQAAECETAETTLKLLSSLCSYGTFPFCFGYGEDHCDFLLDLYSHVKGDETQTGRRVLAALQPVYQSAPTVWYIDFSKRKVSLFLEVLKLQKVKKPVKLWDWSDEESEVGSFLQCLPYISQLSFSPPEYQQRPSEEWNRRVHSFQLDLCMQGALYETQTGEKTVMTLLSVLRLDSPELQSGFMLDLYSHVKDYETKTGRRVLSALQPVYQSAPAVWDIDLSQRKVSLFLEVLKFQKVKKPVELRDWSDEESEVGSFLQCLPYISQLRICHWKFTKTKASKFLGDLFNQAAELLKFQKVKKPVELRDWSDEESEVGSFLQCLPYISQLRICHWKFTKTKASKFLGDLFNQAAECETAETTLKLLSSVCSYDTFPFYLDDEDQCDFLLDLYSHVKGDETQTGRRVLSALQPVYQSAPAVWDIDLSKRKVSLFLEVLKFQKVKKPVKLRDWSDEKSEVRTFLQCLPYISELRSPDPQFFLSVCKCLSLRCRADRRLLSSFLQVLDHTFTVGGVVTSRTCRLVGGVLHLCGPRVKLTLAPQRISLKGASLLFQRVTRLHTLRLNEIMTLKLARVLRSVGGHGPVSLQELSLDLSSTKPPVSRVLSSLASLLRVWTVRCLDLNDCHIEGRALTVLLCHQGPLTIRLHTETLQQLALVVFEAQEVELTQSFLEKVGGDLTHCTLDWNVLHSLLQHSTHDVTVDLKKSRITEQNIRELLPFLHRLHLNRLNSTLVLSALREIFERRAGHLASSLVKSAGNCVNLNTRVLDSSDCAALRFALHHSHSVKLNLIWASITEEEIERTVPLLTRVSQLSVDRVLLLKLLHSCVTPVHQQRAAELLRALQYRLDFSCSSAVDVAAQEEGPSLRLSAADCRAISTVLQLAGCDTQLLLQDCEIEDAGLEELFPALDRVRLSVSKTLLLQMLCVTPVWGEARSVSRAVGLLRALRGELDLSETRLSPQACSSLALLLDHSHRLSELDLSHCQLSDHCVEILLPHLHKARVLDLSNNDITNSGAQRIHQIVSNCSFIETVRLFNNRVTDRGIFQEDQRYEFW